MANRKKAGVVVKIRPFAKNYYICRVMIGLLPILAAASLPNIVFIMCDDLGYGDLGCYGQRYIDTPNLDRMAAEGIRFTQAYCGSPVSAPSRAALMTGLHSGHGHVRGNKEYWKNSPLIDYGTNKDYSIVGQEPYDPAVPIIPEVMKAAGYNTGMFGKWAGGYEGSVSTPDKRGIDEFYGYICQFQAHLYYPNFLNRYSKTLGDTATVRVTLEDNIPYPMFGDGYEKRSQYSADLIHGKALEWLSQQDGDTPFCGIFTYTLPHAELRQPMDSILTGYIGRFPDDKTYKGGKWSRYNPVDHTHAEFAGMITRLDSYVGEILQLLKDKGLAENTLVIFTSDNGPHEEGGADPWFFGRDGKLRGLKRQCYEGGIRIPFIAYWPGTIPAGVTEDEMIAFWDIMPTFCDITGQTAPAGDGFSILPVLKQKGARKHHKFLYWEFHETDQIGLRTGDWKMVVEGGVPHLYNLASDIHEDNDLAAAYPRRVRRMVRIIQREHIDNPLFPVTLPK